MPCNYGCAERFREAAREAGWYLVTEGEWAGWWEHPTLTPYRERRFREVDIDKDHTKIALQRASIRKTAFGVIARTVKTEVKEGLKGFLGRLGVAEDVMSDIIAEDEGGGDSPLP